MAGKNIKNTHPNNLGILEFWILHFDFSILHQAGHPAAASFRFLPSLYSSLPFLCLVLLCPSPLRAFVSWWPSVNYAKRTQFPKPQNPHNPFYPKDLHQYSPSPPSKKQTQTNPIPPHRESIENRVSSIKYPALFMQNKPNFKMGNIDISTASTKSYANEQRTINNERYSKQTQTKPIPQRNTPPRPLAGRYATRNTKNKPKQTQFTPSIRYTLHAICHPQYAIRESSIQHRESAGGLHYSRKMI